MLTQRLSLALLFFLFNDTATHEIYTLSLHDALPIFCAASWNVTLGVSAGSDESALALRSCVVSKVRSRALSTMSRVGRRTCRDRKSTRLNSSHSSISYAVFCLKKKKIRVMYVWVNHR